MSRNRDQETSPLRPDDNAAHRGHRTTSRVPDPPTGDGRGPAALGLTGLAMMAIALAALLLAGCAAGPDRPGPAPFGGRGREDAEAGGEGIGEGSGEGWRVEPVAGGVPGSAPGGMSSRGPTI